MSTPDKSWYYVVEQAIWSPSDEAWGFRHWTIHTELKGARRTARQLSAARIVKCQVVAELGME